MQQLPRGRVQHQQLTTLAAGRQPAAPGDQTAVIKCLLLCRQLVHPGCRQITEQAKFQTVQFAGIGSFPLAIQSGNGIGGITVVQRQ